MDNIRVKKESLSDWRSTLTEETDCDCEGCGQDPCVKCGESHHNINEEIQGGVSVENYADGVQFNEIETVDIIKPEPLKPTVSNWKEEIDIDEGLLKGALSGAKLIGKYALKGGKGLARKGVSDVSKFVKSQKVANRAINIEKIRATKLLEPIKPAKIKWNSTVPSKIKPKVSTISSKQITGSAGTQYKNPIGANPTAKTQYKEPITPKYTRSQKSALTGKAQKVIDQIRGKTPGAKLSAKMSKAYDKNLQKTGDKIIKDIKATPIPKEKAIVKNPGGKMTPSPSGSLAKTTDKGSAIVKNSGEKLTKDVPSNNRKLSAKEKLTKAGAGTKGSGTTYAGTSKPPLRLPQGGPDEDKVRAAVAGASFGLGGYAGTKIFSGKKKDVKEGVASVVLKNPLTKKAIAKAAGAVFAAKGGEKILKDLLGTPDQPKKTDWDKNPKDKIDQELNVKQGQAKDAAKNKSFDDEMEAYRKGKENLSDNEKIERLKSNAKLKQTKKTKKESFSDWRSDLEVVDESAKVMLKIGKRVWKTPGVRKFTSKVPGNLSRATKINPLTKSHALTKQTNSFSVKPLERGRKAGERLAPDRTTLKLDSNMGRPKPKNMSLNTETGDYVPKLKKSNYELVPGAKYGDKVMAKNYKQELKDKEFRKQVEALRKAREPKGIKDKSDINQGALKTLKKSHSDK